MSDIGRHIMRRRLAQCSRQAHHAERLPLTCSATILVLVFTLLGIFAFYRAMHDVVQSAVLYELYFTNKVAIKLKENNTKMEHRHTHTHTQLN